MPSLARGCIAFLLSSFVVCGQDLTGLFSECQCELTIVWPLKGSEWVPMTRVDIDININKCFNESSWSFNLYQFEVCISSGISDISCRSLFDTSLVSIISIPSTNNGISAIWAWIQPVQPKRVIYDSHTFESQNYIDALTYDVVFLWSQSFLFEVLDHLSLLRFNVHQQSRIQQVKNSHQKYTQQLLEMKIDQHFDIIHSQISKCVSINFINPKNWTSVKYPVILNIDIELNTGFTDLAHDYVNNSKLWSYCLQVDSHYIGCEPMSNLQTSLKAMTLYYPSWHSIFVWLSRRSGLSSTSNLESITLFLYKMLHINSFLEDDKNESVIESQRISEVNTTFFVHAGVCNSSSLDEWWVSLLHPMNQSSSSHIIFPPIDQTQECQSEIVHSKQDPFLEKQTESNHLTISYLNLPKTLWELHFHDGFATHQPVLVHYTRRTLRGDIWEFGCGFGSTPLLRSMIEQNTIKRQIISVETDEEWLQLIKSAFPPTSFHKYELVKTSTSLLMKNVVGWEQFFYHVTSQYSYRRNEVSVVFVDNKPMADRWIVINYFKDIARYIVVHDAPFHQLFDLSMFNQYLEYESPYCNGPSTAVMTMTEVEESAECTLTPEREVFGQVISPPLTAPPPLNKRQIAKKTT